MNTNTNLAMAGMCEPEAPDRQRTIVLLMGRGVSAPAARRSDLVGLERNVRKFPTEASISRLDTGELVLAVTLPDIIEHEPDGKLHDADRRLLDDISLTTEEIRTRDCCNAKQAEVRL